MLNTFNNLSMKQYENRSLLCSLRAYSKALNNCGGEAGNGAGVTEVACHCMY